MTRIKASGALARAVPLLSLHCSQGRWPSSHGCPASDAVDEVKPAQDQDVLGGQPGGIGYLGWLPGNYGPAHSRNRRLDRLWTAPKTISGSKRLIPKPANPEPARPKQLYKRAAKAGEDIKPKALRPPMVLSLY